MKTLLFLIFAGAAFAQNPNPCSQVRNTATAGQVLSAVNGGNTPPCQWIAAGGGGGGGTVTSVTLLGTTNQVTLTGTCTITTSGTCTFSLPPTLVLPSGTTGTTQTPGDNSTKIATTAYADAAAAARGTVTSVVLAGTANQITVTGTCTITSSGTCTFSLPANLILPSATTGTTQTQGDNSTKIATTAYTDLAVANGIAGVNPAVAVQACTTAAGNTSALTYNNGASGIGATFTGTANTALTIDGHVMVFGDRLLVKNDTQSPSGAFNGVYLVTQIQTMILPPILTRALDYDTPSDMNNTGAIPCITGTVNASTSWLLTSQVVTVGITPLTYVQFSLAPSTLVTAISPGVGIAHFAGSTQTVTSSAVALSDMAAQAADTVVQNATGGSAAPTAVAMPACTTGADLYNTSTHAWSCVSTGGGSTTCASTNTGTFPCLETHTASTSAELDFTTCIQSGYDEYQLEIINIIPVTNAANILFEFSTDGGATYVTGSSYDASVFGWRSSTNPTTGIGGGTTIGNIPLTGSLGANNGSSLGVSGWMKIYNPNSAAVKKVVSADMLFTDSIGELGVKIAAQFIPTTAVNAFRIIPSSGSITSGIMRCYGIQH